MLLVLLLAGCFGGTGGDDPGTGPPTTTGSTSTGTPEPESDNGVLQVSFESDEMATLEVPTPTLDSCRSPESWLAGDITASHATVELRDAPDGRSGRVLAVTGQGRVEWASQIDLGPACQTFRYDPWSIDPDPEDGTVEVRVTDGAPTHATVLVRRMRDGCGEATLYEGQPEAGWSVLQGRTIPATSCAPA